MYGRINGFKVITFYTNTPSAYEFGDVALVWADGI